MRAAASLVMRGRQAVRDPTRCLSPWGAPFTLTSGSGMLGSTGVEMGCILGFQMWGVPSTAGPHLVPTGYWDLKDRRKSIDSSCRASLDSSPDGLKWMWIVKGREALHWGRGTEDSIVV